ncbi:MAG: Fic family protein [Pirellulaceae bacterium]
MDSYSLSDWNQVHPLCQLTIQSEADYRREIAVGQKRARQLLRDVGQVIPLADSIAEVHGAYFGTVYQASGLFRQNDEEDRVAFGKNMELAGAYHTEIKNELYLLRDQMFDVSAASDDDLQIARNIVFYHAKFNLIHPFLDGNGRIGREIMAYQADSLLEKLTLQLGSPDDYFKGVYLAQSEQHLGLLAKTLFDVDLGPELSIPPYPIAHPPFELTCQLDGATQIRVTCADTLEARDVQHQLEDPDLRRKLLHLKDGDEYELNFTRLDFSKAKSLSDTTLARSESHRRRPEQGL